LSAHWITHLKERSLFASPLFSNSLAYLSRAAILRRLRTACLALLLLWGAAVTARLLWLLLPSEPVSGPAPERLLNPVLEPERGAQRPAVDIERLAGLNLFGSVADVDVAALQATQRQPPAGAGIEEDARETRLDLTLRGIVAAAAEGAGFAMIEHRSRQEVYAVGDALPVPGRVILAKVLRDRVVLENNGTYELLVLYDENGEIAAVPSAEVPQAVESAPAPDREARGAAARPTVDRTRDEEVTRLAQSFRERLYDNPQSLAEVVRVAPVRRDGELQGYRVTPGSAREAFTRLGLRAGDLVTAVNGLALDDPANTLQLYQMLRDANAVTVDLERNGQPMSIALSLE